MTELTRETLYAAWRDKVLAYLTERTESREDAEDLCAEVFEQVCRSLPRFDAEKASVSTWIYQITRFTLIDYFRTRHPNLPLTEDLEATEDLEEAWIQKETLERLALALNGLEEAERDIVVLRYYKGLSLTEISRLTGVSYGMVKVKHKRALDRLRSALS